MERGHLCSWQGTVTSWLRAPGSAPGAPSPAVPRFAPALWGDRGKGGLGRATAGRSSPKGPRVTSDASPERPATPTPSGHGAAASSRCAEAQKRGRMSPRGIRHRHHPSGAGGWVLSR